MMDKPGDPINHRGMRSMERQDLQQGNSMTKSTAIAVIQARVDDNTQQCLYLH